MPLGVLLLIVLCFAIAMVWWIVTSRRRDAAHAAFVEQVMEAQLQRDLKVKERLAIVGSPEPVLEGHAVVLYEDRLEYALGHAAIYFHQIVSVSAPEQLTFLEEGTVRGPRQLQVCWTDRPGAEPTIQRWNVDDPEGWVDTIATLRRRRAGSAVR